jgi:GAF domain-containing protein
LSQRDKLRGAGPAEEVALLRASRAVLQAESFEVTARKLFDEACRVTGARSGYVALLSETGDENEVLFLEAGGLPCDVDPALPMPIRGLREVAYRENRVVYDNAFMDSDWAAYMPAGHVALHNVLFAPLVIAGRTQGIMGLANKDGGFDRRDAELAGALGELCAVALRNSRTLDELRSTVEQLETALAEVRTLRGIIPICVHCKKIRDEQGYWQRVEAYLGERSEAEFSHGLCKACLEELYGELAEDLDQEQK